MLVIAMLVIARHLVYTYCKRIAQELSGGLRGTLRCAPVTRHGAGFVGSLRGLPYTAVPSFGQKTRLQAENMTGSGDVDRYAPSTSLNTLTGQRGTCRPTRSIA